MLNHWKAKERKTMRRKPTFPAPYPRAVPKAGRPLRDPYLYVLVVQTAVCLLVILCALALRETKPALWETAKTRYEQLLMSTGPLEEGFSHLASEAAAVLEQFRLPAKNRPPVPESPPPQSPEAGNSSVQEPEDSQPESGVQVGTALPAMANMNGMGGGGTPENCTFAPVLLTAALEPPTGGRVTSGYGWRSHPITENDDFHRGIDIAAARGGAIHAVLPGVVVETGESAIYGNYIRLDHGHGLQTAYSHCDSIIARQGEVLRKGELLATVGSTGVSTGPHVHFEILVGGTYYDPAWVMSGLRADYGD